MAESQQTELDADQTLARLMDFAGRRVLVAIGVSPHVIASIVGRLEASPWERGPDGALTLNVYVAEDAQRVSLFVPDGTTSTDHGVALTFHVGEASMALVAYPDAGSRSPDGRRARD